MHVFDFDKNEQLQYPIIQKYRRILEKTSDNRVFALLADSEKEFFLLECCDSFFSMDLEVTDCLELSKLFQELAEQLNH